MKKIISLLLATTMLLGVASCAKTETVTEKKTLTIGLDDNFPPMGFKDDKGNIIGFDVDLAKEVGKRMDVEIVFQPIDWKIKELELQSKKVDILWNGLTITEQRKEKMSFTAPYLANKQIILVKNDSGIENKADLTDKIVGLQNDSSAVGAVEADVEVHSKLKEVVPYDNNIMAFQDLEIGRVDAVVVDEIVAKYYLTQNETNFKVLEENFGDEEYGVGVRLEDTELLENIQKALNEMSKDGTAAKISENWFGEDIVVHNN